MAPPISREALTRNPARTKVRSALVDACVARSAPSASVIAQALEALHTPAPNSKAHAIVDEWRRLVQAAALLLLRSPDAESALDAMLPWLDDPAPEAGSLRDVALWFAAQIESPRRDQLEALADWAQGQTRTASYHSGLDLVSSTPFVAHASALGRTRLSAQVAKAQNARVRAVFERALVEVSKPRKTKVRLTRSELVARAEGLRP